MSVAIKIKKGYDIKLQGEAVKKISGDKNCRNYALKPLDFKGIRPKLLVKEGDKVKAGTPLFFSKDNEKIHFSSPVSGEIVEILRGEKRVLLEIRILADEKIAYEHYAIDALDSLDRNGIIDLMLKSGLWPLIRQRPYSRIANPESIPKAIFISAFDSSTLSPDKNFTIGESAAHFQKGLDVLSKLTPGKVHLNLKEGAQNANCFTSAKNVQINYFNGPHPAGNIGVQIHHIDPINKGENVWYCYPEDVVIIGKLFGEGIYDPEKTIAITGSELKETFYVKTRSGVNVECFVANNLKNEHVRVISGNVLTGTKIPKNGYLGFYDNQITVIPEGDYYEMFGWMAPGFNKFSFSKTFLNFFHRQAYKLDTNLHGGERPFILSGQYEKVFPFSIYPVFLLKACITENIDKMEQLGIYEVAPEDFALCEVICTSKINSQDIIEKGIELMIKEMS